MMIFMILSSLAQIIGTTGLASALMTTPVALPVTCRVNQAPIINIRPVTKNIEYDFDKTSAQLTQIKSNTISPYGLNPDQITGGLRHDRPTITMTMEFNVAQNTQTQATCLSYKTINIDVLLQPKIYIAKEFNRGRCGREVLDHEKKHIHVDRTVMNKYTKLMGKAIQNAVNQVGAIGPFSSHRAEEFQEKMASNIKSAVSSVELSMQNEMNLKQQQVDSFEEYERVGQYCEHAAKEVEKARALNKEQRQR